MFLIETVARSWFFNCSVYGDTIYPGLARPSIDMSMTVTAASNHFLAEEGEAA
jgi:hypothetical protein